MTVAWLRTEHDFTFSVSFGQRVSEGLGGRSEGAAQRLLTVLTADSRYFKSETTKKIEPKTKLLCCLYMCQQAGDFTPQCRASAWFFVCVTTRWRCGNIEKKKGTTSFSSSNVDFWIQCPTNKCVLFCFLCSERHNEQVWLVRPSWLVKEEETLTPQLEAHSLSYMYVIAPLAFVSKNTST